MAHRFVMQGAARRRVVGQQLVGRWLVGVRLLSRGASGERGRWSRWVWLVALIALCLGSGCRARLGPEGEPTESAMSSGGECPLGTLSCSGKCAVLSTDNQNCGTCGKACGAGESCSAGVCTQFCVTGQADCAGTCVGILSDSNNCGACGKVCASGQFCDSGVCSDSCSGTLCAAANGQECADFSENPEHCGACGQECGPGMACVAGTCSTACAGGNVPCAGICSDVRVDAQNCGTCGTTCPSGQACAEGACGGGGDPSCTGAECCSSTESFCGSACVDTKTNALHCGICGNQCSLGKTCVAGLCSCPSTQEDCSGACADLQTDNANCGTCGKACAGASSCMGGQCVCADGLDVCGDQCVDFLTDAANCGACGTSCQSYEQCVQGICKYDLDQCGGEARSIDITRVALYQAVEVDLFDGEMVSENDHRVNVVQGRNALVRVFVTPQGGFSARELSARLFIENGGEVSVVHHKRSVSGPSTQSNLASTFLIEVPGAMIQSATKYWVELVECSTLPTGNVGTVRVPTTAGATGEFFARAAGTIKVVFVPLTHDGRTPNVSNETLLAYAKAVEKVYPTVGVEFSARAPIQSAQSGVGIDLGYTLDQVTSLRASDNVAGDVYYYGLIDPASSFGNYCNQGCTTGVGWVPDLNGWGAEDHRAAVGIGFGTAGAGTFSHELGHNHGRNHAPCGGAAGSDPGYPYSNAAIGAWGYDRDAKALRDPSQYRDFMSYCEPTWVSDYNYQALLERISAVNGQANAQANILSGPPVTWYTMVVTSGGMRWSTPARGSGPPTATPEPGIVFDSNGNVMKSVDIHRVTMSHGGGYMLYVPEPQAGWYAVGPSGGPYLAY